jgi:hypothetical protein
VDNISAIRVVGSGSIKEKAMMIGNSVVTIPNLQGKGYERRVKLGAVLVPGGQNVYLVTYGCERDDYPGLKGSFEKIANSFRVTEGRPTPFQVTGGLLGSIKGDLILGLLFGLTLAVIKI